MRAKGTGKTKMDSLLMCTEIPLVNLSDFGVEHNQKKVKTPVASAIFVNF